MRKDQCPTDKLKELQRLIAKRITALMEADKDLQKVKDKVRALAQRSGVGRGSLQRAMKAESAVQTDTLAKLAWTFNVPVWELLHPFDDDSRLFAAKGGPRPEVAADNSHQRDLKSR